MTDERPTVSIVVPCRNERAHIEGCVRSILAQEAPPGGFEVLVADGMSVDGTRDILQRLAREDSRLRIVDNPAGRTPQGMNAGIRQARGRFVAIFGAHTEYARDYVRRCVEILDGRLDASGSGGPIVSRGKSAFGRAVAAAMSHPVGVGNAKHRFPGYEGYAEGACFPVFRREVFDRVGLYDESLVRNQDDDLNYRVALNGGKVFISPRARCTYHVREAPRALFRQYFEYGYWRVAVMRKHRLPASLRQLVPVVFLVTVVALAVVAPSLPGRWSMVGVALPVIYAAILGVVAAKLAAREGALVGSLFPVAAIIMHGAYAAGFAWGLVTGRRPTATSVSQGRAIA